MKVILFSFMVLIVLSWQKTEGQYQDTGTHGKYFPKKVYADKSLPTWEQAQDQLPVPVLTANPEYLELYWKSWQLAFQQTKTTTGLTLACLPVFVAVALAQPFATRESRLPEGGIAHRDFAYVTNGHERQKLDLFLPKDGTNLPLIINIHGGAFKMGSKEQGVPTEYLAQGYAVASINYRLSQHS